MQLNISQFKIAPQKEEGEESLLCLLSPQTGRKQGFRSRFKKTVPFNIFLISLQHIFYKKIPQKVKTSLSKTFASILSLMKLFCRKRVELLSCSSQSCQHRLPFDFVAQVLRTYVRPTFGNRHFWIHFSLILTEVVIVLCLPPIEFPSKISVIKGWDAYIYISETGFK